MSKFQAKSKEMIFESDNVKVAILRLALPTIVSQLITTVYNLADTFWVGKLNDSYQLAALSIIFPVQLFMTALGNLFGIGAGTCISNYLGAKESDKAKRASAFAIWGCVIVAALLSLIVGVWKEPFLRLLKSTENLDAYAATYLDWVVVFGAVPAVFNMVVANVIRGEGYSLHAGLGLSLGGVLNIALDPFFVLPFGLNMNIKGAAIATLISNVVTTLYFAILLIVIRKKSVVSFSPKKACLAIKEKIARNVLFTGLPSALQTMLSAVSNLVLNSLMIGYGETAEAAIGVTKKIDAVPFGMVTGLAQGAAPLIAYNNGAKKYDKMKTTLKLSLCYCVGLAITVLIVVESAAGALIEVFIKDVSTVTYGEKFLRLHCASLPFMAVTFMLVSYFQAVGAKGKAFLLSIIRKGIVDIPLMYLLNVLIPVYGIVACQPITDVISATVGVILYVLWKKKFQKTEEEQGQEIA